jgi:hypothetical protein
MVYMQGLPPTHDFWMLDLEKNGQGAHPAFVCALQSSIKHSRRHSTATRKF